MTMDQKTGDMTIHKILELASELESNLESTLKRFAISNSLPAEIKTSSVSVDESVIRQFVHEAGIEEVIVNSIKTLLGSYVKPKLSLDSSQTLLVLSSLTEKEFYGGAVASGLPSALAKHGSVLMERTMKAKDAALKCVNSKFVGIQEAAYGDAMPHFHRGLEILGGLPHPKIEEEMQKEFLSSNDSSTYFEAWNSGMNVTTSAKEWDFVTEPFRKDSVCGKILPKNWIPSHSYSYDFETLDIDNSGHCTLDECKAVLTKNGWSEKQVESFFSSRSTNGKISRDDFVTIGGGRTPIRLQVFMHALSSSQVTNGSTLHFGNFKGAHLRPQNDPLWLHEEEIGMVKLVLLRFVKSQLDGTSLANAFANVNSSVNISEPNEHAIKIARALTDLFHDPTCTFQSIIDSVTMSCIVTEMQIEALIDYFHKKLAKAKFTRPEIIGLRLYSGPPFIKLNGALRAASGMFAEKSAEHLQGNKYLNTIFAATSGVRKLALVTSIPKGGKVYRGMAGVMLPQKFLHAREDGGRGGVQFGFMSTTVSCSCIFGTDLMSRVMISYRLHSFVGRRARRLL
jgi:hypothetical protein